jgi:hypothetical protein
VVSVGERTHSQQPYGERGVRGVLAGPPGQFPCGLVLAIVQRRLGGLGQPAGGRSGVHAELGGPLVGGGGGGVAVAADRAGASPFQFGCDVLVRCGGGNRQVPGPAICLVRSGARDGERAMRGLPLVVCGAEHRGHLGEQGQRADADEEPIPGAGRAVGGLSELVPWLVDGLPTNDAADVLAMFPPALAQRYRGEWQPWYNAVSRW